MKMLKTYGFEILNFTRSFKIKILELWKILKFEDYFNLKNDWEKLWISMKKIKIL